MKSNRDCKIVEDLLPNYIEGLTSEVTNYFIEEHIQSCEHCQEVLKAMQEQINAEKVDGKEEIDYLKKINRKTKKTERIATISIIVSVLLFIIIAIPIFPKFMWNKNHSGNIYFFNDMYNNEEQTAQWTYYVAEKTIYDKKISLNGEYYKDFCLVQINSYNNKIENYKCITTGISKEFLQKQLKELHNLQNKKAKLIDNLQYNENSYSYNNLIEINNKNINEIMEILLENDDDGIIEKY